MTRLRPASLLSLFLAGALAVLGCRTSPEAGGGDKAAPQEDVVGRFSRWCGKVNAHQSPGGDWTPDSDGVSGCTVGGLAYCRKFWPASTVVRQVPVSPKPAKNVWTNRGGEPVAHVYDGDDEFECVEAPVVCGDDACTGDETQATCPADCRTVLGRFATWCGKLNVYRESPTQNWDVHRDCSSGCDVDRLAYCQKLWPRTTKVRRVDVSGKPNYTWRNAGCTSVTDDHDGDQEFECLE